MYSIYSINVSSCWYTCYICVLILVCMHTSLKRGLSCCSSLLQLRPELLQQFT